jgi:hypothetical protein
MSTDRDRLFRLADDARLIQWGFQKAVERWRRAEEGLQTARECQRSGEPWPESVDSAMHRFRSSDEAVSQFWETVRRVAAEAPLLLPDLASDLVHVRLASDRWQDSAGFRWGSACAELRRIEDAARRGAAALAANTSIAPGAEVPPDDGWHIETGAFCFRRVPFELGGQALGLLRVFLDEREGRILGYPDLRPAWAKDDVEVTDGAIKQQVGILRAKLLEVCTHFGLPISDPLPYRKPDGWKFVLPRS